MHSRSISSPDSKLFLPAADNINTNVTWCFLAKQFDGHHDEVTIVHAAPALSISHMNLRWDSSIVIASSGDSRARKCIATNHRVP